jgi:hypothetical protein
MAEVAKAAADGRCEEAKTIALRNGSLDVAERVLKLCTPSKAAAPVVPSVHAAPKPSTQRPQLPVTAMPPELTTKPVSAAAVPSKANSASEAELVSPEFTPKLIQNNAAVIEKNVSASTPNTITEAQQPTPNTDSVGGEFDLKEKFKERRERILKDVDYAASFKPALSNDQVRQRINQLFSTITAQKPRSEHNSIKSPFDIATCFNDKWFNSETRGSGGRGLGGRWFLLDDHEGYNFGHIVGPPTSHIDVWTFLTISNGASGNGSVIRAYDYRLEMWASIWMLGINKHVDECL